MTAEETTGFIQRGTIRAVCVSERKGVRKKEIPEVRMTEGYGIEGDAHAGAWHRQVSLLPYESVCEMQSKTSILLDSGIFGENLLTEGISFHDLPVGTRLLITSGKGNAGPDQNDPSDESGILLELTQKGKECHDHCAIYHTAGQCIMPVKGLFARVLRGGTVRAGDEIRVIPAEADRPFTACVITLSDRCAAGEREDASGPLCAEILRNEGYVVEECIILPDERSRLEKTLWNLCDRREIALIVTTGGTGFSDRDITPEATAAVSEKPAPGIAAAMLMHALSITPKAALSRQTAGIRKHSLIINLPGSPKAVREELPYILPILRHGLGILRGTEDQ